MRSIITCSTLGLFFGLSLLVFGCGDSDGTKSGNSQVCSDGENCDNQCDSNEPSCKVACHAGSVCEATCQEGQECTFTCSGDAECTFNCAEGKCTVSQEAASSCSCSGNCFGTCGGADNGSGCDHCDATDAACLIACQS